MRSDSANSGDVDRNAILYTSSNMNFPGAVLSQLPHSLKCSRSLQLHCILYCRNAYPRRRQADQVQNGVHELLEVLHIRKIFPGARFNLIAIAPISCLLQMKVGRSKIYSQLVIRVRGIALGQMSSHRRQMGKKDILVFKHTSKQFDPGQNISPGPNSLSTRNFTQPSMTCIHWGLVLSRPLSRLKNG